MTGIIDTFGIFSQVTQASSSGHLGISQGPYVASPPPFESRAQHSKRVKGEDVLLCPVLTAMGDACFAPHFN